MTALERYCEFFGNLEPADLDRLDVVFVENARFKDPFNEVTGIGGIRSVFEHMYANCSMARFEIMESTEGEQHGYIRWRFHFQLKRDKAPRRPFEGVSRVSFAEDGRVREHIDYWDAAGELYSQFPVIGGLMRWLRKRLSVSD